MFLLDADSLGAGEYRNLGSPRSHLEGRRELKDVLPFEQAPFSLPQFPSSTQRGTGLIAEGLEEGEWAPTFANFA